MEESDAGETTVDIGEIELSQINNPMHATSSNDIATVAVAMEEGEQDEQ